MWNIIWAWHLAACVRLLNLLPNVPNVIVPDLIVPNLNRCIDVKWQKKNKVGWNSCEWDSNYPLIILLFLNYTLGTPSLMSIWAFDQRGCANINYFVAFCHGFRYNLKFSCDSPWNSHKKIQTIGLIYEMIGHLLGASLSWCLIWGSQTFSSRTTFSTINFKMHWIISSWCSDPHHNQHYNASLF